MLELIFKNIYNNYRKIKQKFNLVRMQISYKTDLIIYKQKYNNVNNIFQ